MCSVESFESGMMLLDEPLSQSIGPAHVHCIEILYYTIANS